MALLPANDALAIWGLRQYGSLRSVGRGGDSYGGATGYDHGASVMLAVERYFEVGYNRAWFLDVAAWVYCHGRDASDFRWREAGETRMRALLRRGWVSFALGAGSPPAAAFEAFYADFEAWWRANGVSGVVDIPLVVGQ